MSFRVRLFLAFVLAIVLPLGILAAGVRRELQTRLTAEYQRRVDALVNVADDDVARESGTIAGRLGALRDELTDDNRFRLAAIQDDSSARRYLLDYAGSAMRLAGLAMLQVQDSAGRILSSGHFRNAYDRLQPELPSLLAAAPTSAALVRTQTAEGALMALARLDTFRVAGQRFSLVGGIEVGETWLRRLAREDDVSVTLVYPGAHAARDSSEIVGTFSLPYIDAVRDRPVRADTARFVMTHSLSTLQAIRRNTERWFLGVLAATTLFAVMAAGWLASRIGRPLRELAAKTEAIDLDRLDADFTTDRTDEIGALSGLLGTMVERLRGSAARLREAERRVAVGDLARQVNHDVKNGLTPIRHVLRHLSQAARDEPGTLAAVFEERKETLESSVAYLEGLALNYAKLTPQLAARPCDVNAAVRQALGGVVGRAETRAVLDENLPLVLGDDVALRRILENLIGNAADSLEGRAGEIAVSTERIVEGDRTLVRVVVVDTGRGMTRAELDRAFDDFYTTKAAGTGLGLSIVRRLVLDLGGALRIETEPGVGTRIAVDLPT